MKWLLFLLLLLGVITIVGPTVNAIVAPPPGSGGAYATTYNFTLPVTTYTKTCQVVQNGSTFASASWRNPSYVSVYNTYYLQILPNQEYINNNVSLALSASVIALNATFQLASSSNSGSYGGVAIGYGTLINPNMGNYGPQPPYYATGIVVWLEHGAMSTYHLFVFYNGQMVLNASVGSVAIGQKLGIGFWYTFGQPIKIYYYNGSVYTYSLSIYNSMATINSYYIISASNAGPVYGYGQWVLLNIQYFQTQTITYTATFSYYAVQLSNGVNALVAYTDAYNPVNITSNASYGVIAIVKEVNYSVSNAQYPVSSPFSFLPSSNGIYIIAYSYPFPSINSYYINITFNFQFVTPQQTVFKNVTIPVIVFAFAFAFSYVKLPNSTYLPGQTVTLTYSASPNYPPNMGYIPISPPTVSINAPGVVQANYPVTFKIPNVTTPQAFSYTITVSEGSFVIATYNGTLYVIVPNKLPVIFVQPYPTTVTQGQTLKLTFQFSYATPLENISTSVFQKGANYLYLPAQIVSANAVIQFYASWSSSNDGLIIFTNTVNYIIPFNGTNALTFTNNSINTLTISVSNGTILISNGVNKLLLQNTSPIIGIGFYNPYPINIKWVYLFGIVTPTATAGQSYVILIGQNPSTLQQYTTGYVNQSGWATVSIPITQTPYELIDIDWYGVKYIILNISVTQPTTTTTPTVNTSTLTYNYTPPFSNSIQPNSTLYNFANAQPWATVIGIIVVVVIALLGWKFGSLSGAIGGATAGLIMTAYLGLLPWYLFYIFVLGIAMLLAKLIADKFMSGDSDD
ncbi:VP4 [Sulfolobus spindle-shaped virus]|nr:VP4 [Sulfolobus spindle-shaped virus]